MSERDKPTVERLDEVGAVYASVLGVLDRAVSDATDRPSKRSVDAARLVVRSMQRFYQQRTTEEIAEALAAQLRQFGWRPMPPSGWEMRHPRCGTCGEDAVWICHMQFSGSALFCDLHAREEPDFDSDRLERIWGLIAVEQDEAYADFLRSAAQGYFSSADEAEAAMRRRQYRPDELAGRVLPDDFRERAYQWAQANGWVQTDGRSTIIRDPKP